VDKYAIDVFQRRFPEAIPLGDIRRIDYGKLPKGEWVIVGGPPCQPFSLQGRRLHEKDSRNMWPEAIMAVRELRPRVAVFENVCGVLEYLDGYALPEIESIGYKTEAICIPASAFGADHKRERWWIIAYADSVRCKWLQMLGGICKEKRIKAPSFESLSVCNGAGGLGTFPRIPGEDDGIPFRLERLKCLGNAIVPQCAEVIFRLPVFDRWRQEAGLKGVSETEPETVIQGSDMKTDYLFPPLGHWYSVKDGHPAALELYLRHYSSRNYRDGRERKLFCGPGEKMVLLTDTNDALFVWRKFIDNSGQCGVNCAVFRNEGKYKSSSLIIESVEIARRRWPNERFYTYVNHRKIKSTNPGYCFLAAGWRKCGLTKGGLIILELPVNTKIHLKRLYREEG
jgi:hypothetical protein